ncbi:hypothetical protein CPB85DRAFT_698894 [Mucidula mucida]|nr:hypothetical protein CPB85DRAFT_698894 [Mucidula mucida]
MGGISMPTSESFNVAGLPTEIVLDIFEILCQHPRNSLDTQSPPWILGRVCSSWRTLVLSTSSLWSSLIVTPPDSPAQSTVDALREHLHRSRDHPLRIGVSIRGVQDRAVLRNILDLLVQHSRRWKVMEMNLTTDGYLSVTDTELDLKSRVRGRLPLLEEFYMKRQSPFRSSVVQVEHRFTDTLLRAPNLQKADFPLTSFKAAPAEGTTLTHVGARLASLRDVHHISSYKFVTEIHLSCNQDVVRDTAASPVVLPQVIKLGVRHSSILTALTLPSLEILAVRDSTPDSCDIIEQFMGRSMCTLKVLSLLKGELLSKIDITHAAFNRVNGITVPIPSETRQSIAKLSAENVLPALRFITFIIDDVKLEDDHALASELVKFLRGRPDVKLLRLYCSSRDVDIMREGGLAEMESEGKLLVTLNTDYKSRPGMETDWKWWKGPYWLPPLPHVS